MAGDERSDLRILIVDDLDRWRQLLRETLQQIGGVQVDVATSYGEALRALEDHPYDLATVDLALSGEVTEARDSDQLGLELLRELRKSRRNHASCGLIVLTGYPTTARTRQALRDYGADSFFDKGEFDDQVFLLAAQAAIRGARLRRAAALVGDRYRLNLSLGQGLLLGSELSGPDLRASYAAQRPVMYDQQDLTRRGDLLNTLVLNTSGGPDLWRPEARAIGKALYQSLEADRSIYKALGAARAVARRFHDLVIQLTGPSESLGVPFELLCDEDDYLGLKYLLTRRLLLAGDTISRKPEPFHAFMQGLLEREEPLRLLVVGANSDGRIPAAEEEAATLVAALRADLTRLGIPHEVTGLIGVDASFENVTTALRTGRYHIFHYAGHGRHNDQLPEIGGLVLRDRHGLTTITASKLNLLARDTDLHLAFLSCCLGARTAEQAGRGEFRGTLEALARADVPVALGYRWTVADMPARNLALRFYHDLWRSFVPGDALLQARKAAIMGPRGRDDETWAAPVLVTQNG